MYRETGKRAENLIRRGKHNILAEVYRDNVLVEVWFERRKAV